jgi:Zn-dependent protease
METPDIPAALAFYVVFLFSTVLHEAAHAWAALLGGDPTAYHGGQVTLDPRPHIKREPFGMVVMPLIGVVVSGWPFGFASAPYNPRWAYRYPRRAALMALAGPAANLLIVLIAAVGIRVGLATGVFQPPDSVEFARVTTAAGGGIWSAVAFMASVFFSMNLVLAALNLLPLPPLDGSAALPLVLSDSATSKYQDFLARNPGLGFLGILLAWQVFDVIFDPIFLFAINALYPGVSYG